MKWILYWVIYMSSTQSYDVAGVVVIEKHQVTLFNAGRGYITLPIAVSQVWYDENNKIIKGVFLLKNDSLSVTLFVTYTLIEYDLTSDGVREHVELKLKKQKIIHE